MTDETLASRAFALDDQLAFARLSSDWNPLHLDANFARRTQMGEPVVHGIHTLLWTLEAIQRSSPLDISNIKVRFHQPLFPGEIVHIKIAGRTSTTVSIKVIAGGTVVAAIKLSSEAGRLSGSLARDIVSPPRPIAGAIDLPFEQMAGQRGSVTTEAGDDDIRTLFPALSDTVGCAIVRGLLATSQVVGMACPGLHSLFSSLDVSRAPETETERGLSYAVRNTDERFRSLQIDVAGSGICGQIDAFARQPPQAQPGIKAVSARVPSGVFAGQRALVIGGSRGLGEITAKILAAGGAHPIITYREGKAEAEAVAADIGHAGGQCDVIRYDALESAGAQFDSVGAIDSCYYFATAKIFQRKSAVYEPERLLGFMRYYDHGFFDLCTRISQTATGKVGIFYPSTVAIDETTSGLAEYAMAKAAGEILARYASAFLPNIRVVSQRLPRIMTDQTLTVGVASAHQALDVMLPIVHEMQQISHPPLVQ
jgi:acyl dehydratase/NAD(P)-dependent dehydrogenase (short-subunit alcohol dehydrogenase family)